MKKIALLALKKYDLEVIDITFFTEATNYFFKVTTTDDVFMLKIFEEESNQLEDNLAEVFFIDHISSNTNIEIPKIIKNKNNEFITIVLNDIFPTPKRVAIYSFLEGKEIDGIETNEIFYKLGKATAILHQACENLVLPKNIKPKRWDKVFYYRGEYPIYHMEYYTHIFSKDDVEFLNKVIPYFNKKLSDYYQEKSHLIHADLNPSNVFIHNNEIRVLDFEEAMDGTPIQDLAVILFYYKYDKNYDYQEVKKQLFKGYESIKDLPSFKDFDIDFYIIARTLNFINYIVLINDNPLDYIKERIRRVKEFIHTYNLKIG